PRLRHHARKHQHLREEGLPAVREADLLEGFANLLDVAGQRDGVDAEVVGRRLMLAAQLDLDGAALDRLADDFFELGFEEVIRVGSAQRHLEIAVVEGPQFDGEGKLVALAACFPIAGHAQQHANLAEGGQAMAGAEDYSPTGRENAAERWADSR